MSSADTGNNADASQCENHFREPGKQSMQRCSKSRDEHGFLFGEDRPQIEN